MLLVDTNVLLDVLQDDPKWAEWSMAQLRAQAQLHRLAINEVIYAELSLSFTTLAALDAVVARLQLDVAPLPRAALFLAGKKALPARNSAAAPRRRFCRTSSSARRRP
jgi:predicted nucleic acid-binding protein